MGRLVGESWEESLMQRRITGLSALALLAFSGSSVHADLVNYWPFNEGSGTTAEDVVGPNDGSLVNNPVWTTDAAPTANANPYSLYFDGNASAGYVNFGDIGQTTPATISMWIKPIDYDGDTRLYSQVGSVDVSAGGAVRIPDVNTVQVWNGGAWVNVGNGTPVTTGAWHHVAFVFDTPDLPLYPLGRVTLYLNGVPQATGNADFDFSGANRQLAIGATFYNTYGSYFNGRIDDVSVWNEVLDGASVALLAEGASPLSLVPEPASMALLAAGGLVALRRR
jgi:hypothetical protein